MKRLAGVVAAAYFAAVGLLLLWGAWLLLTNDPDGGRHPVGGAMVGVSLLFAAVGVVFLRRSRRPR